MEDIPQKSWAMVEIHSTSLAKPELRALVMIGTAPPPPASIVLMWVAAKVIASSTIQPASADQAIEWVWAEDAEGEKEEKSGSS